MYPHVFSIVGNKDLFFAKTVRGCSCMAMRVPLSYENHYNRLFDGKKIHVIY
jgi:hypothetical protein